MKYFLAITPPLEQEMAVLAFRQQWGIMGGAPHITVKAPCGLVDAEEWLPAVQQFCQVTPAPVIQLRQTGVFEPTILYWRVESPPLIVLHQQLLKVLNTLPADQGDCFEGHKYIPHMTLCHLDSIHAPQRARLLEAASSIFSDPIEFLATSLTVFSKSGEAPYQKVMSIPLIS